VIPAVLRGDFDVSSGVLAQAGAVDRQYAQRREPAYEASLALTQPSSGRRPLGEQVAHRTRLTAEKVAEERVDAREASLAGSVEEPE
jgi:hypothetical protein